MPTIDMSLDRLKQYMGINPRPADFDEFWDSSLEEMNSIDPQPVFRRYEFPSELVECYELTFRSTQNATIYAKFMKPKRIDGKAPAILRFHGYSGASSSWISMLSYASNGFCVAAMDCRGQGGFSEDVGETTGTTYTSHFVRGLDDAPEKLYCRNLFLDTAMLARIVMELDYVDEARVGVMGGSQGGALSIACAALVPSINRCFSVYPYLSDYKRVWEMDLDKGAYEGLRYYFRHFDPNHAREDEIFEKLGYVDIQFLAPRIRAKLVMATGLIDTTCPPSTQFAAYNKITSDKELLIYPDFGHEGLPNIEELQYRFAAEML